MKLIELKEMRLPGSGDPKGVNTPTDAVSGPRDEKANTEITFEYDIHASIPCLIQAAAHIAKAEGKGGKRYVDSVQVMKVVFGPVTMSPKEVSAKYGTDALPNDDMLERAALELNLPRGQGK
jgi:hypothetical protein